MGMNKQGDERLNTLSAIAQECFGIETLPLSAGAQEVQYVVCAESIVRALESAYDIGLIAGYRLHRVHATYPLAERYAQDASARAELHA
jgi:hypothetical protein